MKKLLLASLLVVMFAGMAMAQPANETADVNVTAYVGGVWEIALSTTAVELGTALVPLDPGATGTATVDATIRTNQKIAWYLKLNKDQDLTHTTDATEVIPSANFTWAGTGGGGTWENEGPFNLAATRAYTAASGEYKNLGAGTTLTTDFSLLVPADAVAGTYTNTITYTLTATP